MVVGEEFYEEKMYICARFFSLVNFSAELDTYVVVLTWSIWWILRIREQRRFEEVSCAPPRWDTCPHPYPMLSALTKFAERGLVLLRNVLAKHLSDDLRPNRTRRKGIRSVA